MDTLKSRGRRIKMSRIDKFAKGHYKDKVVLFALALHWRVLWDNSNPDVGMGPMDDELLTELINTCGIELTKKEREAVLEVALDFDD